MESSEKWVHGRDKLIAENPAIFYSNRFKRVAYDFSKPWTMVSGISKEQFYSAKDDQQALLTYFPYKEMSAKNNSKSGFNYLKGDIYLDYNDFAGFFLRCSNSSGVQVNSDYTKGDFIAAVDFGLKWTLMDIDIVNSASGVYSYSDIYNDYKSLWVASTTGSGRDKANFVFKDTCLCEVNGFSSPMVYTFNLNDVPNIRDYVFNNGIYKESEAQGYKGELFNFTYPKSFSELSSKSDEELTNMTLEDYTFTKGVVSIKFTDNANDPVSPKTSTEFIRIVGDEFSKKAGMTAFNILTGIGKMFTISVPEEYYINAIFFSYGLGGGHALLVNGEVIYNNLSPNGLVNDTSLPICPIEDTESIWKANSKNLTSVSFADVFSKGGAIRNIRAIYVSYAKKEEALIPPTISDIDTGKGSLKAVDLGLSVKWASHNIGATKETDRGNHYAWGSTQTSNIYNQSSYEWYDAPIETYKIPATNIAETKYDVAAQMLRGKWRMPTDDEFNELINKCTWIATDDGFRVIGPNKNEIFLPFTGVGIETGLEGSKRMFYWSCKYNEQPLYKEDHLAYSLTNYTSEGKKNPKIISSYVYNGMCIRPVEDDNLTLSTPDTPSEEPSNPDLPSGNVDTSMSPITLVFTDTGTVGYSVDPNEILYAGGQEVIPNTFAQKDNTLFMANYKEKNALITDKNLYSSIKFNTKLNFNYKDHISKGSLGSLYMYDNQLKHNSYDITTFKGGELYRFGLIFQDSKGQWSGVVPLYDYRNTLYPRDREDSVNLVKAVATIPTSLSNRLYSLGYRRVQGVVVYPSEANRRVICQGVLCPTVYNINDRINNAPYAVSSWFFREMRATDNNGKPCSDGTQNLHNCNIYNDIYDTVDSKYKVNSKLITDSTSRYLQVNGSISAGTFGGGHTDAPTRGGYFGNGNTSSSGSSSSSSSGGVSFSSVPVDKSFKAEISSASIYHKYAYETNNNIDYFVDWNTLTMNTPEVNFSLANTAHNIPTENLKMRIVGVIPLTSSSSDIYVNTNSEYIKQDVAVGLKKINTTYNNNSYQGGNLRGTTFEWNDFDYHLGDNKSINLDDTDQQCINPTFSLNNFIFTAMMGATGETEAPFGGIKSYPIYPWQGAKSLLGQPKEVMKDKDEYKGKVFDGLNKKVIANIRTSSITYYFPKKALSYDIGNAGIYDGDIPLVKLNKDNNDKDFTSSFNYYGELDTIINPTSYYYTYYGSIYNYDLSKLKNYNWGHREGQSPLSIGVYTGLHNIMQNSVSKDSVRIRYKSSPHIAFHLKYSSYDAQTILPSFSYDDYTFGKFNDLNRYNSVNPLYIVPGWSDKIKNKIITNNISGAYYSLNDSVAQQNIALTSQDIGEQLVGHDNSTEQLYGYLYIGELYQDFPKDLSEPFGGTSSMAYEQNHWHKAGPIAELNANGNTSIEFLQGDTYYQRYDCLKTYPYSSEDPNQIVEILSFMCETRMNIDGRYDINRGNSSNLNATPQNFNLFNPVYTQEDNFINHYYLDPEKNKDDTFSNTLLWTKTKTLGEEIDSWTNINQVSSFNMDGDKGAISAVRNYNDNLVTFQDNGIARVLYNERVQVNTSDGVPIELSNSGKVSGKQYISDTIGCSNRDTIQITPEGIYFMDSNSKDIMLFNNGIKSVSKVKGFNSYLYNRDFSKYKAFYDEKLKDVYFTDDVTSLDFNEQLGEFEGFYSYGGTDYMFNYLDNFIAIKDNKLWKQFAGDYNYFFGNKDENCKPFSITLISNEGAIDKTFTGMEYEADTWDNRGTLLNETFDYLNVWNEYQTGVENLRNKNINNHYHFSNLKKKFRIWRAQMPRELDFKHTIYLPDINKEIDVMKISERTIDIKKMFNLKQSLNRIRNTWAYIKLSKNSLDNHKTILHNINIDYFY